MNSASGGSGSGSLPPAGSALSTHHELQLVREQLDQQCQQTQAAMAQLQLAREQLAAEQVYIKLHEDTCTFFTSLWIIFY